MLTGRPMPKTSHFHSYSMMLCVSLFLTVAMLVSAGVRSRAFSLLKVMSLGLRHLAHDVNLSGQVRVTKVWSYSLSGQLIVVILAASPVIFLAISTGTVFRPKETWIHKLLIDLLFSRRARSLEGSETDFRCWFPVGFPTHRFYSVHVTISTAGSFDTCNSSSLLLSYSSSHKN